MARPTNKKELLELSEVNFNKLLEFIDGLPDEIKTKTIKPLKKLVISLQNAAMVVLLL